MTSLDQGHRLYEDVTSRGTGRRTPMHNLKLARAYARYALSALAVVAFGRYLN